MTSPARLVESREVRARLSVIAGRGRLFPLFLVALGLLATLAALPRNDDPVTIPPQALGRCRSTSPQLVIPVLDVSSSVIEGGADPHGRSFAEMRALADALAKNPCSPNDRMGVVIFADRAVELEPTRLTSLSLIDAALRRPPRREVGGGTNIAVGLQSAIDMTQRFPTYDPTVVLLSDVQDGNPGATAQELHRLAPSHLVLVGLGKRNTAFDADFGRVFDLGNATRGEVAAAMTTVVRAARERS